DLRGFEWRYLRRLCHGESLLTLPGPGGFINCLALSPDGKMLAVGNGDWSGSPHPGEVRLWELAPAAGELGRPRKAATLRGPTRGIASVASTPNSGLLAAASYDGTITVWGLSVPRSSPDGAAAPRVLRPPVVALLHASGVPVRSIVFSPDGRTLASGGGTQR